MPAKHRSAASAKASESAKEGRQMEAGKREMQWNNCPKTYIPVNAFGRWLHSLTCQWLQNFAVLFSVEICSFDLEETV